jgi:hypothetical protein
LALFFHPPRNPKKLRGFVLALFHKRSSESKELIGFELAFFWACLFSQVIDLTTHVGLFAVFGPFGVSFLFLPPCTGPVCLASLAHLCDGYSPPLIPKPV